MVVFEIRIMRQAHNSAWNDVDCGKLIILIIEKGKDNE